MTEDIKSLLKTKSAEIRNCQALNTEIAQFVKILLLDITSLTTSGEPVRIKAVDKNGNRISPQDLLVWASAYMALVSAEENQSETTQPINNGMMGAHLVINNLLTLNFYEFQLVETENKEKPII